MLSFRPTRESGEICMKNPADSRLLAVCTKDEMLAFLDGKIKETQDSYGVWRYVLEKVDLLRSSGWSNEAGTFVSRWIDLPEVRRHEVEGLQKEQRYDEALDMLDDGIKAAAEDSFGRYQHEWVEMRLHIHELQGDCQSQIEDCRWLFCNTGGNLDYYHKLKKLVPPSDWKIFLKNMMAGMIFSCFGGHSNAADIYVEEKDYPRLFKTVSDVVMASVWICCLTMPAGFR